MAKFYGVVHTSAMTRRILFHESLESLPQHIVDYHITYGGMSRPITDLAYQSLLNDRLPIHQDMVIIMLLQMRRSKLYRLLEIQRDQFDEELRMGLLDFEIAVVKA